MKSLRLILVALMACRLASGDTPPPGAVQVRGGTDGTHIGNVGDALKVTNVGGGETVVIASPIPSQTVTIVPGPSPIPVSGFPSPVPTQSVYVVNQPSPVPTQTITGAVTIPTPVPITGSITASDPAVGPIASPIPSQASLDGAKDPSGNLQALNITAAGALKVDGSGVTQPVSGTFWQTTQPVSGSLGRTWTLLNTTDSVNVGNFPSTFGVTQSTSPWVISGSVSVSNFPSTQAVTQSGTWSIGRTWDLSSSSDSVSAVQSGTWNIGNITGTVSLPTGAATSSNQTTGNGYLSNIQTYTGNTSSYLVGFNGPVSPGTAATNSLLVGAVYNSGAVSLSNGQQVALQADSAGNALVDVKTALPAGTNTIGSINAINNPVSAAQSGTWNLNNISGTISLPTGAATASNQTNGSQITQVSSLPSIPSGSNSIGTVGLNSGSNTIGSISNISGTVSLPTGAATAANQTSVIGSAAGGTAAASSLLFGGQYNSSLPTLTTGQQSSIQLDSSGRQIISPLSTSSTVNVNNISGTVSLPTGAATSANQATIISDLGTISTNQTGGSQKTQIVDGSGNVQGTMQTVSGVNYAPVVTASSGSPGSSAPSRATQIGGADGSGNLRSVSTDSSGTVQTSLGNTAKTIVALTGNLISSATTSNQTIVTHTVATGKTFYILEADCGVILNSAAATQEQFGTCSIMINGSIVWSQYYKGAGSSPTVPIEYPEPLFATSGQVVQWVATPAATTAFLWTANFGGYEK
jgi:hypothetical protein